MVYGRIKVDCPKISLKRVFGILQTNKGVKSISQSLRNEVLFSFLLLSHDNLLIVFLLIKSMTYGTMLDAELVSNKA